MIDKYPETVRVVFKNFPLRNHAMARPAAVAALSAAEQGKFWEYHDRLFEQYRNLSEEAFLRIAKDTGLDVDAFQTSRRKPEHQASINRDAQEGSQAGVRGTPTIFVNGRRLGQRSIQGFTEAIDRELAQSREK